MCKGDNKLSNIQVTKENQAANKVVEAIVLKQLACDKMILWNCYIYSDKFFCRKSLDISNWGTDKVESEYIKNLQQQVYFLELETNYLYPFIFIICSFELLVKLSEYQRILYCFVKKLDIFKH